MSVWFVKPEEVRLDLIYTEPSGTEHPFWIRVKKELTVGEQRRVTTAGWRSSLASDTESGIHVDWKVQTFARTEAYLTGWSLAEAPELVPLCREAIEGLEQGVYDVIEEALNKHIESVKAEKKIRTGPSELKTISA